jgi:hypothetical protein
MMSEMPQDIWEKANEIYRLIANPTKLEQMASLLTPQERIAYALWAERKRGAQIAKDLPLASLISTSATSHELTFHTGASAQAGAIAAAIMAPSP